MSRVGIVAGAAATRSTLGEPRFPTFFLPNLANHLHEKQKVG